MSGTASRFGPLLSDNGVTFRLWAPAARAVNLVLDRKKIAMPKGGAWFAFNVRQARAGARYHFEIDGDIEIPDPASHFQPDDVTGPSEVIDHRYEWRCSDWKGRPWHEGVFSKSWKRRGGRGRALIFSAVAVQSSGMRIVSIFSGHFVHETSFCPICSSVPPLNFFAQMSF